MRLEDKLSQFPFPDENFASRFVLRLKLKPLQPGNLQSVTFQLRDLEQEMRRAFILTQTDISSHQEAGGKAVHLSEYPTNPTGYQIRVDTLSKSSPTELQLVATSLPTLVLTFAIFAAIQGEDDDFDLSGSLSALFDLFDLPAKSIDSLRGATESLARLVATVLRFGDLVEEASLEIRRRLNAAEEEFGSSEEE